MSEFIKSTLLRPEMIAFTSFATITYLSTKKQDDYVDESFASKITRGCLLGCLSGMYTYSITLCMPNIIKPIMPARMVESKTAAAATSFVSLAYG